MFDCNYFFGKGSITICEEDLSLLLLIIIMVKYIVFGGIMIEIDIRFLVFI